MTGERIVRSVLLSAALALGVVGCPPEPPDDDDAGIGGSAPTGGTTLMGGRATGGTGTAGAGGASGGTAVSVCQLVTTLPEQNSSCGTAPGESRCLANGDRCVCVRGVWYCNTECAKIPEPVPGTDCSSHRGAACNYANGVGCVCSQNRWTCTGNVSSCPAFASPGDDCTQPGTLCDYIGAAHLRCECIPGSVSTWTCVVSGMCPIDQPVYPAACTATRLCTYGNVQCTCVNGGQWICDWPLFLFAYFSS